MSTDNHPLNVLRATTARLLADGAQPLTEIAPAGTFNVDWVNASVGTIVASFATRHDAIAWMRDAAADRETAGDRGRFELYVWTTDADGSHHRERVGALPVDGYPREGLPA